MKKNISKIRYIYFITVNSWLKVTINEIIVTHGTYLLCHVLEESKVMTVYNVCSTGSYIAVRLKCRVCRVFSIIAMG